MRRTLCAALAALLLICLSGCKADISAYEASPIQIIGLTDEPFSVTPKDLMQMKCISATSQGNSDKAGTVEAYGPTLETFVSSYGHSLSDFRYVRLSASDGYDVTINQLVWDSYDIILSVSNGTKPLEERQRPLRVVIPGYDSGKWVRLITKIEFSSKE